MPVLARCRSEHGEKVRAKRAKAGDDGATVAVWATSTRALSGPMGSAGVEYDVTTAAPPTAGACGALTPGPLAEPALASDGTAPVAPAGVGGAPPGTLDDGRM